MGEVLEAIDTDEELIEAPPIIWVPIPDAAVFAIETLKVLTT